MELAQDESPAQTDSQECAPLSRYLRVIACKYRSSKTNLRMDLNLKELVRAIVAREVSPVEVAQTYLERISQLNPALNAIVTVAPDVLERARAAETVLMRGDAAGALHGVPVTIKDTIDTAGLPDPRASETRADLSPTTAAPSEAPPIA